jgi:hypothetical protein
MYEHPAHDGRFERLLQLLDVAAKDQDVDAAPGLPDRGNDGSDAGVGLDEELQVTS